MAQAKLVMALSGEIFDVAVDIRRGSPTYGQWVGEVLSAENHRMLYIPRGFAHGFCVLSDAADFLYYVTAEYSPDHESGILWNDPTSALRGRSTCRCFRRGMKVNRACGMWRADLYTRQSETLAITKANDPAINRVVFCYLTQAATNY